MRDDGRGFDVKRTSEDAHQPLHIGLQSLDERLALAGGELELTSQDGAGTQVSFWLPLTHADD